MIWTMGMAFALLPETAEWRHDDLRSGIERTVFRARGDGWTVEGATTGRVEGQPWEVRYILSVDSKWMTRHAHVVARGPFGD